MPRDFFDFLSEVSQNSSLNPLLFYIVEVVTASGELVFTLNHINTSSQRLESLKMSFLQVGGVQKEYKNGKERVVPRMEQQEMLWRGFLQKEYPALLVPFSIYIKSIQTLENKIALLINFREGLLHKEHELLPRHIREDKKLSAIGRDLLEFFKTELDTRFLLKQRDGIEHRKNKMNKIIKFFLNKKPPTEKDLADKIADIEKIVRKVQNSHVEIQNIFIPKFIKYLEFVPKSDVGISQPSLFKRVVRKFL